MSQTAIPSDAKTPPQRVELFSIPAMDCAEELAMIEKGLARHPGIATLDPLYIDRQLRVRYDTTQTDSLRIAAAISDLGFPAQVVTRAAATKPENPRRTVRWWTTLGGGVLLLLAGGAWLAGRFLAARQLSAAAGGLDITADVLCVLSAIVAGAPVAKAGWRAIRLRTADMNLLMTIAAVGALAIGDFFEAATAMLLFGISLFLENYSLERTRRVVHGLASLTPKVAHRLSDGQLVDVDTETLQIGDTLVVKPGERVPVDGEVIEGASSVNEAPVSGESVPVEKQAGAKLFAGSLNGEGALTVKAMHTAQDSTVARIGQLVLDAQASRAPTARFVDEFARRYTPTVIALAAVLAIGPTLLSWLGLNLFPSVTASQWLHRALVILVIACPCSLVISTPVTIVCGLYQAARRGLLVKGGEHLESAAAIDCVAIDKTGTLTTGRAEVVLVDPAPGSTIEEVLRVASSLESHSEHPLAAAILRAARLQGIELQSITDLVARRGFGVEGMLDGQRSFAGSPRMFATLLPDVKITIDPNHAAATAVCIGNAERYLGTIYLSDSLRSDAADAVAELRRGGVKRIIVLSGDRHAVADAIGRQVGADAVEAELLPEDKVRHVRELAQQYPNLAMVGDGVNDAPALAMARLGIAMGNDSSDLAVETADVVVLSPHLQRVAELLSLGRRTRRLLWQNIGISFAIKALVLVLAVAGPITMWMAVAADVGATLIVIFNGMRLVRR